MLINWILSHSDSSIPLEESSSPLSNLKSTFKGSPSFSSMPYNEIGWLFDRFIKIENIQFHSTHNFVVAGIPVTPESPSSLPVESSQSQVMNVRQRRPTPPNSLNLACTTSSTIVKTESVYHSWNEIISTKFDSADLNNRHFHFPISDNRVESNSPSLIQLVTPSSKTPPPPPPRWTKPPVVNNTNSSSNFSVTTTLTLSVNKETHSSSPDPKTTSFQVSKTSS